MHTASPKTPSMPTQSAATYLILSAFGFVAAALIGLQGALKLTLPAEMTAWMAFELLRPLHTFLAMGAVLAGLFGLVEAILVKHTGKGSHRFYLILFGSFLLAGPAALMLGQGTGREYFPAPAWVSVLLIPILFSYVVRLLQAREVLTERSPEGYWLLGFGSLFILLAWLESHLRLADALLHSFTRDLSVQWHAIDTMFAGMNTVLFGTVMFMMSAGPKPLRPWVLFAISGFSVLLTFGHHHYVSGQPGMIKTLAVIASMVAILSLVRHFIAWRKAQGSTTDPVFLKPVLRSVEFWVIVSVLSGVIFAVPQINLITHGTYLTLIHAMGSMIGVNFLIIVLGAFAFASAPEAVRSDRVTLGVRLTNWSLGGLWLVLGASGLVRGVMRIGYEYAEFQPIREAILIGFPVLGIALLAGIAMLSWEAVRAQGLIFDRESAKAGQVAK
jgi:hypothetical protein